MRREPSLSQRHTASEGKSQWERAAAREIVIRFKEKNLLWKGTEH